MIPNRPMDEPLQMRPEDDLLRRKNKFQSRISSLEDAYVAATDPGLPTKMRIAKCKDFLLDGVTMLPQDDIDVKSFEQAVKDKIIELSKPQNIRVVAKRNSDWDQVYELSIAGRAEFGISYAFPQDLREVRQAMEENVDIWIWTELLDYVKRLAEALTRIGILTKKDLDPFEEEDLPIEELNTGGGSSIEELTQRLRRKAEEAEDEEIGTEDDDTDTEDVEEAESDE